jgi:hypothetical protein
VDKEAAIRRIKKLAALVASDNPHESEAAARQMAAMMEEYRISEGDLRAAEVEEQASKAGALEKPVRWECHLAMAVAEFYGCDLIFSSGFVGSGRWLFIGVAPAGQLAAYAFDQLFSKARSARRNYMATELKRLRKASNKTAKADLFAEGWVRAVERKLRRNPRTPEQEAAVEEYKQRKYRSGLGTFKGRQNTAKEGAANWKHRARGAEAGDDVALHAGVTTGGKPKQIGRNAP